MSIEELKRRYGEDYPAAVVLDGVRISLSRETRFSRSFYSAEGKTGYEVSRFMDGSASISLRELELEWSPWAKGERLDFCQACSWLHDQSDFPDMLRFIMQCGGPDEWSAIALSVGARLPQDEAFGVLSRALRAMDIGATSNIAQGIAKTKHPDAEATLRGHLRSVWAHTSLWDDNEFINWVAFDATMCIAHLLELGAPPSDFDGLVRELSQHECTGIRDSCRNHLAKYYPWLQ